MAIRPIDANALHAEISKWPEPVMYKDWVQSAIATAPTLTPPNEWAQVLEAINNEAVAYIEGGPYKNDLPGMELALKIDRLSRDFVRPPEGEEKTR